MTPRPFRLVPRITRTPQLGWTYLRWGRRLRRIDPVAQRAGHWLGWAQDVAALACMLIGFGWLTLQGIGLVAP